MNEQKPCSKCGALKTIDLEFFRYDTKRGRWHSWCRTCENTYAKAYFKSTRGKKATKKWRQKNPEKCREYDRQNRKKDPERHASYDLKKRIGITLADKLEQFLKQGKKCAICRTDVPNMKGTWFADHDHTTKKFRGVLCGRCNSVLGYALDNPSVLIHAALYLLGQESK